MSDILKVTTPIINKNQPVLPKHGIDPTAAFNIQETAKVIQTHNQSELLKQNTGTLEGKDAPTLLLSLLKDPAVAASYLKNISLIEELFKLLPAKNTTMTKEIEQAFDSLMLSSKDLPGEMLSQESLSTSFKGELFDLLRQISTSNPNSPMLQDAVASQLKAMNNLIIKGDILDAIANSLTFLKEGVGSNKQLSAKLDELINAFKNSKSGSNFSSLKDQTLALLKDVENSILFSPSLKKNVSIITYNLSRFNDSEEFLKETSYRLRQLCPAPLRQSLIKLSEQFLERYKNDEKLFDSSEGGSSSRVMDALVKLIRIQSDDTTNASDAAKLDKILHSLLSSPCNFTPLLHYIIPLVHEDMKAFAEIWINPESDDSEKAHSDEKGLHFLLVIDADDVGRFEAEFMVHNKIIDFSLFCPPGTEEQYSEIISSFSKIVSATDYRSGTTRLGPLERSRSLMDVFKSLPYKRIGVDVRI